jgi:hypothetical protein
MKESDPGGSGWVGAGARLRLRGSLWVPARFGDPCGLKGPLGGNLGALPGVACSGPEGADPFWSH